MAETLKLFESQSCTTEFDAVVLECRTNGAAYEIILDRTCFFPEGGGQPSDWGTLGEASVLGAQETGGVVLHITDKPLLAGSTVRGRIDWQRRLSNMQQHSGEHVLSGIICRLHGYDNVGFHIGSEVVTLDFNGALSEHELAEAESLANEAIYADLDVKAEYPDGETLHGLNYRSKKELDGRIRIVTIPGIDCCACCGTHVRRTGEIGMIKVISAQKYKGGTRVSILCGMRALEYFRQRIRIFDELTALLSAKPDQLVPAVGQLLADNSRLKAQQKATADRLFAQIADGVAPGDFGAFHEEGLAPDDLRRFALLLGQKRKTCAVFTGDGSGGSKYAIVSADRDARQIAMKLNEALNGRGGGTAQLAQGSVAAGREQIDNFLERDTLL